MEILKSSIRNMIFLCPVWNLCLMEFWQISDHFIIVICLKYLLKSGLKIGSLWPEVLFLAYPKFWKISVFNGNVFGDILAAPSRPNG